VSGVGDDQTLTRFLGLVLCHAPDRAGVQLDLAGWVTVDGLLAGAASRGRGFSREQLERVVELNAERRFALDDSGLRIRAVRGHSVSVDLELQASVPPAQLFYATSVMNAAASRHMGLQEIHPKRLRLSIDASSALLAAVDHRDPVIVTIDAAGMTASGELLYRDADGAWVSESIAPRWLSLPADWRSRIRKPPTR
jgi:putative RNA 2'-phosphotransferase